MTCPMAIHLGVYALGSADAAERLLVEDHLPGCASCRAELARLAPLPSLLAKVPHGLVPGAVPVRGSALDDAAGRQRPVGRARTPARSRRFALAAAVIAAAGFAGGFWLMPRAAAPATASAPADEVLSAANQTTHVRATAALTGTSWGTSIQVTADGLPRDEVCWLVIRSRAGQSEVTAYWTTTGPEPVRVPAAAAWTPSDISEVQVVTQSKVLLTITAGAAQQTAPARTPAHSEG